MQWSHLRFAMVGSSGGVHVQVAVSLEASRRKLEDEDVVAERARIEDGRAEADRVQLRHLRKVYATQPPKVHTCRHMQSLAARS